MKTSTSVPSKAIWRLYHVLFAFGLLVGVLDRSGLAVLDGEQDTIEGMEQDARVQQVAHDLHHREGGHELGVGVELELPSGAHVQQLQVPCKVGDKEDAKEKARQGHPVLLRE